MIILTIDGQKVQVAEGTTVLEAAQQLRIKIPTLCYHKALPSYGACRLCLVEVSQNGGRSSIQASCTCPAQNGLVVKTDTERIIRARRIMAELLLARCPDSEKVKDIAKELGVKKIRIKPKHKDCLLCGLCVRMCHSRMGRGAIGFAYRGSNREVQPAFDIQSDVCQTCGACFSVCPTQAINFEKITKNKPRPILSEFDEGLRERSAIYVPFPQAVPNYAVIDKEHCVSLQTGECKICQDSCEADAINFDQKEEILKLNVGSIIIASGFQPFDPAIHDTYQYNHFTNVVTSLEFERILSASGPYAGHLIRPSDKKAPKKIAWIQCVGSRNTQVGDKGYCSAVCCTYAIKQAMIAKEHASEPLDTAIFYIDVRTHGKDFERYYNRAQDEMGIRFVKSRISNVFQGEEEGDLRIRYTDEAGRMVQEDFDIVVLSIGLDINQKSIDLAKKIGIELDKYNFVDTSSFEPVNTSRPGVYVCGAFEAPKDIPDTVAQASAAAAAATSSLSKVRGTRIKTKEYPSERDVSKEPIKIGAFICHCGINIGGVANVPEIVEYAKTLPYVDYVEDNLFTCAEDTQVKMKQVIIERQLNRVVVASCTPRTHEVLFRETCRQSGLNPYLFEMANIRDQCTWVHMHEPKKATQKAKDLVHMAIAKVARLKQLNPVPQPVCPEALVIGGGVAGMTAALELARQGFKAYLIEKEDRLGGQALRLHTTWKDENIQSYVEEMVKKVNEHSLIDVHLQTEIKEADGIMGNFRSKLVNAKGKETEVNFGAAILANGAESYEPGEYLYGEDPNILLSLDLDQKIMHNADKLKEIKTAVFIQCVGSREPSRPYCSKVCCTHSIKNALTLKKLNPDINIYILYRDIRTYGEREDIYREARSKGIHFIPYEIDDKPLVEKKGQKLKVIVKDQVIKRLVEIDTDIITLASAVIPRDDNGVFSKLFKVAMNQDGFFMEAHVKLRPVDFSCAGIFVCGLAHSPKFIEEAISQAKAAASRATTVLVKDEIMGEGIISSVNEDICAGCGFCEMLCPYSAIEVDKETRVAKVNKFLCQGCGACAAACPSGAVQQNGFMRDQMLSMIGAFV